MFSGDQELTDRVFKHVNDLLIGMQYIKRSDSFEGESPAEFANFIASLPSKVDQDQDSLPIPLQDLFSLLLSRYVKSDAIHHAMELAPISRSIQAGVRALDQFFSSRVKYLGPLRDDPRVLYSLPAGPDPSDVGVKGQYTAAVLDRHKTRMVRLINPASGEQEKSTLEQAVATWLRHMGMLQAVSTSEAGKLGYRLGVQIEGIKKPLDLTTVGVGVSQVLPILVMALLADQGTLLIFEQPEIHLHPRVQSLLGDFFLSMSQLGKQCLVETHSEHLVNRLRLRVAQAEGDDGGPFSTIRTPPLLRSVCESPTFNLRVSAYIPAPRASQMLSISARLSSAARLIAPESWRPSLTQR